mmetsp:Transcript_60936/g.191611  ORF Transcript_60936/g.191611 Transcript_60936/m.191611 type:complete len:279 (+) Transcript_60936:205-1041(+)
MLRPPADKLEASAEGREPRTGAGAGCAVPLLGRCHSARVGFALGHLQVRVTCAGHVRRHQAASAAWLLQVLRDPFAAERAFGRQQHRGRRGEQLRDVRHRPGGLLEQEGLRLGRGRREGVGRPARVLAAHAAHHLPAARAASRRVPEPAVHGPVLHRGHGWHGQTLGLAQHAGVSLLRGWPHAYGPEAALPPEPVPALRVHAVGGRQRLRLRRAHRQRPGQPAPPQGCRLRGGRSPADGWHGQRWLRRQNPLLPGSAARGSEEGWRPWPRQPHGSAQR